ncbi:MAG TPA: helix-hairpin-helix domain-containing protein [Thermoplasmata archaeon]|nr:helix-hairpin-helix domain-containing protein [Thermoplasmata archaeon]
MTTNQELVEIFRSIADILDLEGERFKPEAYRRAARSIESLAEDIRRVAERKELDQIPGVGAAIGEKIQEYLRDGKIAYYERVQREVPAGALEIMRLPGVGPKTARRFLVEFGIEGPQELSAAIDAGRFRDAKGFGARKLELLKQALGAGQPTGRRRPLLEGWTIARTLVEALRAHAPVDQIEVAGSLRRRRESVGDLDILVTSRDPPAVLDAFGRLPAVRRVTLRGTTKETVIVESELQVDLRVVDPESFGAALQYFTGSKDHNVHLRTIARDRGLKVNEYGVFRGDERVAGRTEEEVYGALDLPWIPAEMREDHGEVELAQSRQIPALVDRSHVPGDLHVHLEKGDGAPEVDRRLQEAHRLGWAFVGFAFPASDPPTGELEAHLRVRRAATAGFAAARFGFERPWDAPVPSAHADFALVSAEGRTVPPSDTSPRAGLAVVHLALAPAGSEATPDSTRAWVDWASRHKLGLEVTPRAAAEGLDSAGVRAAREAGVRLLLSAGTRGPGDPLDALDLAIGLARRAWLGPSQVLNADPVATTRSPTRRRSTP